MLAPIHRIGCLPAPASRLKTAGGTALKVHPSGNGRSKQVWVVDQVVPGV
jgi:hypothetical protein